VPQIQKHALALIVGTLREHGITGLASVLPA